MRQLFIYIFFRKVIVFSRLFSDSWGWSVKAGAFLRFSLCVPYKSLICPAFNLHNRIVCTIKIQEVSKSVALLTKVLAKFMEKLRYCN